MFSFMGLGLINDDKLKEICAICSEQRSVQQIMASEAITYSSSQGPWQFSEPT